MSLERFGYRLNAASRMLAVAVFSRASVDTNGNALSGNNEKFKISAEIDNIPPTKKGLIGRLIDKFSQLSSTGSINAPSANQQSPQINNLTKYL